MVNLTHPLGFFYEWQVQHLRNQTGCRILNYFFKISVFVIIRKTFKVISDEWSYFFLFFFCIIFFLFILFLHFQKCLWITTFTRFENRINYYYRLENAFGLFFKHLIIIVTIVNIIKICGDSAIVRFYVNLSIFFIKHWVTIDSFIFLILILLPI